MINWSKNPSLQGHSGFLGHSMCIAYLCFWDKRVRSPSTISENSYSIIYTTVATKVIICIVTMIAFVASTVRIDGDTLTDFKNSHFRSEFIDSTYKLMSKSQRPVFFTRKASLKDFLF